MPNRSEKYTLYFQSLIDELWEQYNLKCHRLFRPQFRKVKPSFAAQIP